jgi:YfiH family protein
MTRMRKPRHLSEVPDRSTFLPVQRELNPLHASCFPTVGIAHGFFTRQGGVSTGIYESLNCGPGSSDAAQSVAVNRARVTAALGVGPAQLVTMYQVHGADCVRVERPWMPGDAPRADGCVTNVPGLALGILTADCTPVLFADVAAGVIGAAHAGWKGARAGVLESTLAEMEALGADRRNVAAAIGPCIAQPSYEVGPEFRAALIGDDPGNDRFFIAGAGDRSHFDLPAYVMARLVASGIARIERVEADTAADPARFFSYRRTCLAAEPDYGRQISAIALLPA